MFLKLILTNAEAKARRETPIDSYRSAMKQFAYGCYVYQASYSLYFASYNFCLNALYPVIFYVHDLNRSREKKRREE